MEIDIDIIINEFAASKGRKLDLLWNVDYRSWNKRK